MPIFSSHKSIPSASWLAVSCLVLLFSPVAQGQSQQSGALRSVAAIIAETEPVNDAVLADAPSQLHLVFPARVRLVKLVLYGANHEWVDIGFRYNPGPQNKFSWPVPELPKAAYYSAFWAMN